MVLLKYKIERENIMNNKKDIISNEDNRIFKSVKETAIFYGVCPTRISKHLNNPLVFKTVKGKTFCYRENNQKQNNNLKIKEFMLKGKSIFGEINVVVDKESPLKLFKSTLIMKYDITNDSLLLEVRDKDE